MPQAYRIEITAVHPRYDSEGRGVLHELNDYGLTGLNAVRSVRVFTIGGNLSAADAERAAKEFLADAVVDTYAVNAHALPEAAATDHAVEIIRRAGVMDPSEKSILKGLAELGLKADWVRCSKKFVVSGNVTEDALKDAALKMLANDVIEEVAVGHDVTVPAPTSRAFPFVRREMPIADLDDKALQKLSTEGQLYMSLPEMKEAQAYFKKLGRVPSDVELESIAQTWSEHCVHKTFRGKIKYKDLDTGEERFINNLLKTTVAKVTHELAKDWCWSVFVDNAGVIDFDGKLGAVFKVETHNHPSAIEPYGGAGTGLGGCIRDPMGTGLGAKPVMNTDVFCFGPPDLPRQDVPKGALHPMRVMKGVVSGVRDYGNRMGIPTTNGAVFFDKRYIGNPLVFCGNVAVIPKELAAKRSAKTGQLALVVGGRTGRDGIHGATFSSVELDESSEVVSSGAVQIGNPIEEKKVLDFLLRARDAKLFTCITDCGAGGLSSALGEMGSECGVEVELDKVPLKYAGLSYTEIWISEAQERMVMAVDADKLPALQALADEENVEITAIAKFRSDGKLILRYNGTEVANLDMEFLHDGVPQIEREAVWKRPVHKEPAPQMGNFGEALKKILGSWNVCSKEWIIRQYDHEVQSGSVIKPLVGEKHDGPGDAAVVAPVLGNPRAIVVSNGLNPKYSDIDPYAMAASAIDEALRNVVAVGGDLSRCAVLDNFCWGNCDKPDRLGGLVRAAQACYDIAKAYGVPFISGKDSLNNEFATEQGTTAIPGTLLVSAMSIMDDLSRAVTMDLKKAGNPVYAVGLTKNELGASHYYALRDAIGNNVPTVDTALGMKVFTGVSNATKQHLVRAAHDCSEGGAAAALAEMAFAGCLGVEADLSKLPGGEGLGAEALLFSESNSRLMIETTPGNAAALEAAFKAAGAPFAQIGRVTDTGRVVLKNGGTTLVDENIEDCRKAWKSPLAL